MLVLPSAVIRFVLGCVGGVEHGRLSEAQPTLPEVRATSEVTSEASRKGVAVRKHMSERCEERRDDALLL